MPTPPLSEEKARQAVEALREHGTVTLAAQALKEPRATIDARLKAARGRPDLAHLFMEPARVTETTAADGSLKSRSVTSKPIGESWEPPPDYAVKRISVLTDAEGRELQRWTRVTPEARHLSDMVAAVKDILTTAKPMPPAPAPEAADTDLLTVLTLADVHLGQLSWGEETGEDWNLREAVRYVTQTASLLIGATPQSGTAVVLILGDFLHADDSTATTPTHKHNVDVDSRHSKVMRSAVELAMALVSMAAHRHQRVIVRVLPGNHDIHAAPAVGLALWAAYREDPRVQVDFDPRPFWVYEHGKVLIGAQHGDKMKLEKMPLHLAASAPEAWGRTSYRVVFSGHRHHQTTHEAGGVICRCLPAVTARDAYAASRGYHAARGMTAFTFHRETGPWMTLEKLSPPPICRASS